MNTFIKAQLSSFWGYVVDYTVMLLLTEVAGISYSYSIILSGMVGAVVNFLISHYWAFNASAGNKKEQIFRFSAMVLTSVSLKSYGTFIITTCLHIDYKISRLAVDFVVAFGINFPLQKYWIFKNENAV